MDQVPPVLCHSSWITNTLIKYVPTSPILRHCLCLVCWPGHFSPVTTLIKYVLGVPSTPRQDLDTKKPAMVSTPSQGDARNSLTTSTPDQTRKVSAEVDGEESNLNNTATSNAFSADGFFMDI